MRRLIAASLFLSPLLVSAKDDAAPPDAARKSGALFGLRSGDTQEKPYIEGGAGKYEPDGRIVALPDEKGRPPVLVWQGLRVSANGFVYDPAAKTMASDGAVQLDAGRLRIVAEDVRYRSDAVLHRLETGRVRIGVPPVYIAADGVDITTTAHSKVVTSQAKTGRVTIYYNEPDFLVLSVDAKNVSYVSAPGANPGASAKPNHDNDRIEAEDVVFKFGPIPVFWLPSYSQTGLDGPALAPVELDVGSNNRYGPFLRTTTLYTASKSFQPGLLLDAYGKSGVLAGPALRYDTAFLKNDGAASYTSMKGELQAGFIEDSTDRGTDQYNRPIPEGRYFIDWRHKQTIADKVEVTASIHAWSDPFAARDFRQELFDREQQPDNFVEVVYPDRDFYASVFARFQPNPWQDIAQRLPEIRFDLNPREIADTRIYQRGYVSFAYLTESTSEELPVLPGTTGSTLATPRLDAYYGLTRPVKPDAAFSVMPVAGVRSTTWFDAFGGDPTYSRLAGQVGFDAQAVAEGRWNAASAIWDVNGLRHKLRPVVQYRYMPGAIDGASRIPDIDRWTFLTAPPPIDLSQRVDTDELHETQILRLGLENLFQTRDKTYGSRDLLGFDVYQDFRDTNLAGERTLSDTYLRETIKPAPWLDWQLYQRISPYTGALHQISTQAIVADGDRWKFTLGYEYATDVPRLDPAALAAGFYRYGAPENFNQLVFGWEYRINAQFRARTQWRVNLDGGSLAGQTYALSQQLGHSWQIEYVVGENRDARGDSGWNFGVRLRLNTF